MKLPIPVSSELGVLALSLLGVVLALVSAVVSCVVFLQLQRVPTVSVVQDEPTEIQVGKPLPSSESGELTIAVLGAVNRPGLYKLPANARVATAIEQSGGLDLSTVDTENFDSTVELARILQDGETIRVPRKSNEPLSKGNEVQNGVAEFQTIGTSPQSAISVNTATTKQLQTLPGIGEAWAQKIIQNRPFISLQDMQEKLNLPDSLLGKISNGITFSK